MGRVLTFAAPHQVVFDHEDEAPLKPDEVRLRTLYSGISAGTELTYYRGTNPYIHRRWDLSRRLFLPDDESSLSYPIPGVGYEEVGEVIEVGAEVSGVAIGARVFGAWGHRTHHVVSAEYARDRLMPDGHDTVLGIYSHIGSIAINGIHDSRICIGDTVAVFGLGVLGQIVAQLARKSGARVIGVDIHESRLKLAEQLGTPTTLNAANGSAAEAIKDLTGGRGADVCIEVTGATAALNEAIRAVAYSARVVSMGFFQGEARGLYLGDEFHHNRINVVCSQISGVDPAISNRWNRLRLAQAAISLQADGVMDLKPLISHTSAFEQAPALFAALDEAPQDVMQAVMSFETA